jgi:hypothetical protein
MTFPRAMNPRSPPNHPRGIPGGRRNISKERLCGKKK